MMKLLLSQEPEDFNATMFGSDRSGGMRTLFVSRAVIFLLFAMAALLALAPIAGAQVTNWGTPVFADEFNGTAGVFTPASGNNRFWTFNTGQGVFGTGEIEDMVADGTTSYLDGNGHLVIKTYLSGANYFSARFKSQGFDFQYGRVESNIQIPTSQAIWPAFWMLGDNGVTWPGCGEIDIMENNGAQPNQSKGTIHGIGYANVGLGAQFKSTTPLHSGFHKYGVIWSPFLVQFYVDNPSNVYASYTPGEVMGVGSDPTTGASTLGQWDFFGHPFFIVYDVAVGGGFVGPPGPGTVVPQFMNIDYVHVYQTPAPAAVTSLTATPISNSQVQLSWGASSTAVGDPGITYNIFRSTTPGAAHNISNTNMANMISTGVHGTSFTDVMLKPGTTYYYVVTATGQESGESPLSNQAVVTLPTTGTNVQAIAISSGSLVGTDNFVQDVGFNLGASNAYPDVIDVSKVTNPAPQGVYRTERWGPTTYTIPNLTPGASYTVRLHLAEVAFAAAGLRNFNVAINGATVLSNFDIFAAAGGEFIANIQQFNVKADNSGTITIAFTLGTSAALHKNPSIRGIEIIPQGGCAAPGTPTNFSANPISSSEIDLSWAAVTGPACGGAVTYTVTRNGVQIASGLTATSLKDTGLATATTYNYTVKAVNSAGASAPASASATTSSVCTAPSAPTGLSGMGVSNTQINLSWTASTANCTPTYNIFRSTTSGFTPSSSNQIASGVTATRFSDTGLVCNFALFYYLAEGSNSAGTSAPSNQATVNFVCPPPTSVGINSGGPAVAPFVADEFFTGGGTINHANTIDLSGVTNPAPMAVYQTARIGAFTYTVTGSTITAGSSNTVRLHFAETYWTAAGKRLFNVSINGTQVLTNFDIFAAAGAKNKAVIKQFTANANASGQYVIKFTPVTDNALVSGIEVQVP